MSKEKRRSSDSNTGEPLIRRLKIIAATASVFALVVFVTYLWNFHGPLSSDPSKWGQFGDYVGGALNPIFSFFALIALLLTIVLQSEELAASRKELANSVQALRDSKDIATRQAEHFETQAKKEDVYRMIKYVFDELNTLYSGQTKFTVLKKDGPKTTSKITVALPMLFGENMNRPYYDSLPQVSDGGKVNYDAVEPFRRLLCELMIYLQKFESLSGDELVTSYYKKRYAQSVWDMHQKGYIDVDTLDFYQTVHSKGISS